MAGMVSEGDIRHCEGWDVSGKIVRGCDDISVN